MTKTSTYPLRLPVSLKVALEKRSKQDGISMNQFVVTAVAEKISALNTATFSMSGALRVIAKRFAGF